MDYIIRDREPKALYNRFEDICAIPHGSGHEGALADFISEFAERRGLYVYRDANNNVLVRRPASHGYEDHAPVMIQGHIDMVCEAESWNKIDFLHDGLELKLNGSLLTANGTTLGADDGVAVAIMLALLEDESLEAPTIECLFTTEEETGLTGASMFDYGQLRSRRMINLDTGGEVIIVSCAGGMRTRVRGSASVEEYEGKTVTVSVDGLAGGHSGADIHLGLGNANLIALELVCRAREVDEAVRIVSMSGGSKDNAIPSRCTVTLTANDTDKVIAAIKNAEKDIRARLTDADAGMTVTAAVNEYKGTVPSVKLTDSVIGFTKEVPCGVISMCADIDMVETSQNYAIVELTPDGLFELHISSRSSVDEKLDEAEENMRVLASKYGFETITDSRYNGWAYSPESEMRDAYIKAYRELTGHDIPVMGIHAGLECGIIRRAVPDMDIIATGARTLGEHTTKEALDLDSFALVYNAVKLLCSRL